jgi:hypothetical protein
MFAIELFDVDKREGIAAPMVLPEFARAVVGEEAVQDLPSIYIIDVLSNLLLHGLQSWYWEESPGISAA